MISTNFEARTGGSQGLTTYAISRLARIPNDMQGQKTAMNDKHLVPLSTICTSNKLNDFTTGQR